MPVRVTEASSSSGGGLSGASDVVAAALWTADFAFEYAAAGVQGINLHWGTVRVVWVLCVCGVCV